MFTVPPALQLPSQKLGMKCQLNSISGPNFWRTVIVKVQSSRANSGNYLNSCILILNNKQVLKVVYIVKNNKGLVIWFRGKAVFFIRKHFRECMFYTGQVSQRFVMVHSIVQ